MGLMKLFLLYHVAVIHAHVCSQHCALIWTMCCTSCGMSVVMRLYTAAVMDNRWCCLRWHNSVLLYTPFERQDRAQ